MQIRRKRRHRNNRGRRRLTGILAFLLALALPAAALADVLELDIGAGDFLVDETSAYRWGETTEVVEELDISTARPLSAEELEAGQTGGYSPIWEEDQYPSEPPAVPLEEGTSNPDAVNPDADEGTTDSDEGKTLIGLMEDPSGKWTVDTVQRVVWDYLKIDDHGGVVRIKGTSPIIDIGRDNWGNILPIDDPLATQPKDDEVSWKATNTVTVKTVDPAAAIKLILDNLNIDATYCTFDEDFTPIDIQSGQVTIELDGSNRLIGSGGHAAIETSYKANEGSLTITDTDNNGSLYAEGSLTPVSHHEYEDGTPAYYHEGEEGTFLIWDMTGASPGIGGGITVEYEPILDANGEPIVDTVTHDGQTMRFERTKPVMSVEDGVNITIKGGNITAAGGVEVRWMLNEDGQWEQTKVPYYAPAIGGAVMTWRGDDNSIQKRAGHTDVKYLGGNVTLLEGEEYENPWYAAPGGIPAVPEEDPVTVAELMLSETVTVSVANGTITEEVTSEGLKVIVVTFEPETKNGVLALDVAQIDEIVSLGYSTMRFTVGGASLTLDLTALRARIGEGYTNLSLRYIDGKMVLTAVDADGKLIDLSDLLTAA